MTAVDAGHEDRVRRVARRLADAGVGSPEADARVLIDHVVRSHAADASRERRLEQLVERRCRREPLQLVIGHTWFRHLEVVCDPGVFIPRPETEIVAGLAIAAARDHDRPRVVEPCCGTGAIGLSVAVEVPGAQVVASDVDPVAVTTARRNLDRVLDGRAGVPGLAPGATVDVRVGDLVAALDPSLAGRIGVLVANPPYLPASDRTSWEPEVRDHDPEATLVGGVDGHEIVDALLAASARWLAPGGTVVIEIDERRADDARAAAMGAGLDAVRIESDLTGAARAVVASRQG